MAESTYQYEFEAEKNQDANAGFRSFDTLKKALDYIEEGGTLRVTCNPTVKDRIHTRTVYLTYEKIVGLSEEEIVKHLDQEVEKSLIEAMEVNYGNIKELSLADLILLEGWFNRRLDLPANASSQSTGNTQASEEDNFKYEITAKIRDAVSSEISSRVTRIFPHFEI
jgi:hypothetical protein